MRFGWLSVLLLITLPATAAAQSAEVARGYFDGNREGSRPGVLLPFVTSAMPGPILALTNGDESLSNNQIVATLVAQTAIAGVVSYLADLAMKPRPTKEQELQLAGQTPLYVSSWRKGYRDASGQRRITARVAGVVVGAVVSAVIYSQR